MQVVCSYCHNDMGEKEPLGDSRLSHGICQECYIPLLQQEEGLSLDEYLETFNVPVMVINSESRVAAANSSALNMLNKSYERVHGLLGGEAMECQYARLPGGCGQTSHCETCTIRMLVHQTLEDKIFHHHETVYLMTDSGRIRFLVSTVFKDGKVLIIIEDSFMDE